MNRPPVRRWAILIATSHLTLLLALWAGCTSAPSAVDAVPVAPDADPLPVDTVTVAEPDPVVETPPPDDGDALSLRRVLEERPDLAQLDDAYRQALDLLARAQYDVAEDLLFMLKNETITTLPADRDSLARCFLSSLDRRVSLLAGVLAEDRALSRAVADDDSLLAIAYDDLRGLSFPDSLIPVSGERRREIHRDLLQIRNESVDKWIAYFTGRGRRSFQVWLDRKAGMDSLIYSHLDAAGLPRELIYLAAVESGFNPRARSGVGAVGLWQFMASTARHYHLRCDWWVDERRDPEMATRAAVTYLTQLYHHFGDWALVLAAYNTGEHRVDRAIKLAGHDDFWRLHLPWQTRNHVPKIIAAAVIGEDPLAYGFDPAPAAKLAYDVIDVTDATDLNLIARCADATPEEVVALNPALLREATPPGHTDYPVRVPEGTGAKAMRALRSVPLAERLTWRRHIVERGETLGAIARRYGTSVRDISRLNEIRNAALIHPGDRLLIPMPAELAERARKREAESGHYVPPSGYERVSYKVRSGDTLSGIARKLGVTLRHLRRVNNMHGNALIRPGDRVYAYRPPKP